MAAGAHRIFDAATRYPYLVAGKDQFDSVAMAAFAGRLMQKGGAEGVQCGAIRDKGWGYALKCDDGNMEASRAMVAALLMAMAEPEAAQAEVLWRWSRQTVRNVRGREVGVLRAVEGIWGK